MGKVVSVWGSPNSGKTTLSIKLAKELAKKNTVMVVFTDILSPTIPALFKDADNKKSIGNVLSAPILTENEVLINSISVKNNKKIAFLGYARGENVFNYPPYQKERAVELIGILRELVDYVIIDLQSNFVSDQLSTTALEISDEVLRVSTPYVKDVMYYDSYLPLISENKFRARTHINILSKYMINDAVSELSEIYDISERIPFIEELREQSLTGDLLSSLSMKEEKNLKYTLQNIINIIDGNEALIEAEEDDYFEEKSIKDKIFGSIKGFRRKEV